MTRYRVLICLILVCLGVGVINGQTLQEAEQAYLRGDMSSAITFYELALIEDHRDSVINTNLGHAYYVDGQLGKALQHYLRAQRNLPRNEIVSSQIDRIRSERIDSGGNSTNRLSTAYTLTASRLTLMELSVITFILWVSFFVVMTIGSKRRGWLLPAALLSVVLVIALGLLGTRLYLETQRPAAVVIVSDVQVMSGPGDSYLPLFILYEANDLRVLESRDGWVRFALEDGRQGWIEATSVGFIPNDLG